MSSKNTEKTIKFLMSLKHRADPAFNGEPFDVVIPVMGPTGVGKSTFINSLLNSTQSNTKSVAVGHGLGSCTSQLEPIVVEFGHGADGFTNPNSDNKGRLVIVDTPGFDDTYISDGEILRRISVWLGMSYAANMQLGGVIYLHDITQSRTFGTTRQNLRMFQKLVGPDAPQCVVFGTTKWSLLTDSDVGAPREEQLKSAMKDMVAAGARVVSVLDESTPRKIINSILDRAKLAESKVEFLKIQDELVRLRKFIPQTEAGQSVSYSTDELTTFQKRRVEEFTDEEFKKGQQELERLLKTARELPEVPLGVRIKRFFNR